MMASEESPIERGRSLVARTGIVLITAAFLIGLVLWGTGQSGAATGLLAAGCVLLVAMPIVSIIAAFAEEVRRREWAFACAAAFIILLLAFSIATRLA